MQDMKETLREVKKSLGDLSRDYPDLMKAFSGFMGEVEKDGALDRKTKELISVSLSIVKECRWCIAFHVKNALAAGASKQEIMEACFVAALMGGGPALMYTQLAVKALDDFSKK